MENLNVVERRELTQTVREILEIYNKDQEHACLIRNLTSKAETLQANGYYYDALIQWNKVLCNHTSHDDVTYVYNQRSKIYKNCKLYNECLNNIRLAESSPNIADELKQRKLFCEDALKQQKKVVEDPTTKDFLKLSYVANPKLPFAIDCLKVRRDNVYGYHIITEQDLNIGDVVCVESPFFTIMFDNEIEDTFIAVDTCKQRCFHCFKYNNLNLISCFNCKLAMFCSDTCQDAAFKMYHKYECLIMKKLDGVKDLVGRLRPFFLALSLFDGSVDRMKATLQGRSGGQRTVFDYDLSDPLSHTYAINLLHVFDSYTTTQHSESFEQINTLFTCDPELNIIWKGNESFVHMLLCRFNDVLRCLGRGIYKWPGNATDIAEQLPDITDSFDTDLVRKMAGVGYYPFLGLINHSCVQNISRHIDADNKMVLIVCRPIKKGEQLFDDYMGHLSYCKVSKIERYNELWRKYSFFCSCLACTGDLFPVINEQVVTREKLFKMATLVGKGIRTWNQETARKKYLCFIEMLQDFYTTLPTREVSNLHHWTFVCLAITNRPDFVF